MTERKLCFGLTGRMASGKGEAVRILSAYGFAAISLSDIVRAEAAKINPEVNRGQMQDIGNRLRAEGGPGILGAMVRDRILASSRKRWVIDGIRNPAEVRELKKINDFFLIGIACDIPTILARMKKRGRATDAVAEMELRGSLEREWGAGEPEGGQQVGPTLALADFMIANDGTLKELQARLDEILEKTGAVNA
jgi:dephospho-CoA kinase